MHNGPCRKNNDILNELQEINKWLIAACSRAKDLKSEITERIAIKRKKGAKISGADTPNLKSSKENRFLNTSSNRKNEDDDDQTSSQLNDSRTSGLAFNNISPTHSFSKPEPQKAQTKIDLKVEEKPANSGSGHVEQEVITIGVFSGESGGAEKSDVPNGKHSKGSAQNENISTESDESEIDDGDKFDSRGKANYSKFRVYMKSPDPEQRSQVNSSPNLTAPEPVILPPVLVQDQPKLPSTAGAITSSITGIVIRNEKNEEDDRPAVGDGLFDSEEEASGRGDEDGLSFTSDLPVAAPPMKMSAFGQAAKQEVEQKQQPAKPACAPVVEKATMLSNPTSPSHATSALNQLKGIESLSPKHKKIENKSADSDPCFGDMVGMSDSEDDDPPPKKNEPVKKSGFSIEAKPQPPAVVEPEPPRPEPKSEQKAITMTNKQADALPNPPDFMAMLDDGSDKDTSSIDDRAGKEKMKSVNNDEPEQPVLRQTESSIASYSFDASKRFLTKDNGEKQRAESVQPSKVDLHDEKKEADRKAQVLENLAKFKNSSNKQQFKTFIDHPKTDMTDQDKAAEKQEMEILKTANQYFTKIAEYVEHVQTHPDSGYHTDKQMKEFLKSIIENESFPIHDIKETAKEILGKVEKRIELIQMRSAVANELSKQCPAVKTKKKNHESFIQPKKFENELKSQRNVNRGSSKEPGSMKTGESAGPGQGFKPISVDQSWSSKIEKMTQSSPSPAGGTVSVTASTTPNPTPVQNLNIPVPNQPLPAPSSTPGPPPVQQRIKFSEILRTRNRTTINMQS